MEENLHLANLFLTQNNFGFWIMEITNKNELDVLLPSASKAQPMVIEPQELTINIQNSGAYFVGGKTVNQQELLLLLTSSVLNNPSQTVVIRADQRVEFVFVATAMDLCNQAGIFDYTVATSGEM